jgi:hypothetical protein
MNIFARNLVGKSAINKVVTQKEALTNRKHCLVQYGKREFDHPKDHSPQTRRNSTRSKMYLCLFLKLWILESP